MATRLHLITLADAMNRRIFLQSLRLATGVLVFASQLPHAYAQGANPQGPEFQLKAPEPKRTPPQ